MKHIFIIISVFSLVLLNSCNTYDFFTITVLEPAEIAFPVNYKKLVIAHNLYRSPSDTTGTSYSLFDVITTDTTYLYAEIARESVFSLQDFLNASTRFESVVFDSIQHHFPRSSDDFTMNDLDLIRQICHQNNAEALVLLNDLSTFDKYEVVSDNYAAYFGEFEVKIRETWFFIDPFKSKLVDSKSISFATYYQTDPWYFDENMNIFDFRKDVLLKSGIEAGINYGRRISPYWSETDRIVFKNGSREIRKGYKESQSGNWENAETLWRDALMNPKNINQARATFNIGLANEMNGSLEPAIEWVQKSIEIFPDTINKIYLQILENRLLQQDDLFYQMEGSNTDKP